MIVSGQSPPMTRGKRPLIATIVGVQTRFQAKRAIWAYLFLLPWILGLVFFIIGPIIVSLYLSFTKYDILSAPEFIGFANYHTAFFEDELFWPSVLRTVEYSVGIVPLGLVGSLMLAMLLNRQIKGISLFRTLYFLPSLTPTVALALLFTWLFDPNLGLVNEVLSSVGIAGPGWFASPKWALTALAITSLWATWGGSTMLIFLAGLQGVERSLHEAAEIDGAGRWSKFIHVTLPMISPTILFNLILGLVAALQVFTIAYVATEGGPDYATYLYALHIFNQAFKYFQMGYGSALAWLFVIVLLGLTLVQLRLSRRWVFYGGASD